MVKIFSFVDPFKPDLLRCLIHLMLGGGHKYTKIGLAMGVKIGFDVEKSGKNTDLFVIMCMGISWKISLL